MLFFSRLEVEKHIQCLEILTISTKCQVRIGAWFHECLSTSLQGSARSAFPKWNFWTLNWSSVNSLMCQRVEAWVCWWWLFQACGWAAFLKFVSDEHVVKSVAGERRDLNPKMKLCKFLDWTKVRGMGCLIMIVSSLWVIRICQVCRWSAFWKCLRWCFEFFWQEEELRKDENLMFMCRCSFLEIYNEQITDLLEPTSTNLHVCPPWLLSDLHIHPCMTGSCSKQLGPSE